VFVEGFTESEVEAYYLMMVVIGDRYWSAFITYGDSSCQLVSVSYSRPKGAAIYEGERVRQAL
jgi:hypothetical protein